MENKGEYMLFKEMGEILRVSADRAAILARRWGLPVLRLPGLGPRVSRAALADFLGITGATELAAPPAPRRGRPRKAVQDQK